MQITSGVGASIFIMLTWVASYANAEQEVQTITQWGYPVNTQTRDISGFNLQELRNTLEFCLDLDSEDDRAKFPDDNKFYPHPSSDWGAKPIYDSRQEVLPGKLDPANNGFDAFQNAWTLWKNSTPVNGREVYAIAIRGTVFASQPSAVENLILTTSSARLGIEHPKNHYADITFSDIEGAEVHTGFSYATFSVLFDARFGLLKTLIEKNVPPGSILLITGHSQGAAMATLMHAFLYYAMQQGKYSLSKDQYLLKSYVFAQAKPGNVQFAMSFSEIAGAKGLSYVINNTLDPVPLVPLTLEFVADVESVMPADSAFWKLLRGVNNIVNDVRTGIAEVFNQEAARKRAFAHEHLFLKDEIKAAAIPLDEAKTIRPEPVSQTYVSAGALIPVRGKRDPDIEKNDVFYQHHSPTYRDLVASQLGS
jgi:hypothetical protein